MKTRHSKYNLWKHCAADSLILLFTQYKTTWLTADSAALPAKMSAA